MNGASQVLIQLMEKVAEEEERTTEDVMQDLMDNPRGTLKSIFTAERLASMVDVPDTIDSVRPHTKQHMSRASLPCQ